jgi:hypothetical protein
MDFSYWAGEERGVPAEKARALPRWRQAGCFSELELAAVASGRRLAPAPVPTAGSSPARQLGPSSSAARSARDSTK